MKKTVLAAIILLLTSPLTYAEEVGISDIAEQVLSLIASKGNTSYGVKFAQLNYHGITDFREGLNIEKMNAYGLFYEVTSQSTFGTGVEFLIGQEVPITSYGIKEANISSVKLNGYLSFKQYLIKKLYAKTKMGYAMDKSIIDDDEKVDFIKQAEDEGVNFGYAMGIDMTPHLGILAEYTYFSSVEGNSALSVGLYYRN